MLIVGGTTGGQSTNFASAELYDPATSTWSSAASLATGRYWHTATTLANGKVLVAGGYNNAAPFSLASAELYDPVTNAWSGAGNMTFARRHHTATALPNGLVLVAGGMGVSGSLTSAQLYNPANNAWSNTSSLAVARYQHAAAPLADGRVLVIAGLNDAAVRLAVAEVYAPDLTTQAPTLASPGSSGVFGGPVSVSFSLPEAALAGSVKLTFDNGAGTVRDVTLAPSEETAGAHTFSLPSFDLASAPQVLSAAGGNTIPDGTYTVTLSYQDALGNPAASANAGSVLIYSTLTPAGFFSATGYGPGEPAPLGFFVPTPGSTSATPAPPGTYVPTQGAIAPTPASPGFFVDSFAQIMQFSASPGTFVPLPGAAMATTNPVGTWSGLASPRVRSAPTPRNAAEYIVGPVFNSTYGANGGAIALGTLAATTPVMFTISNASADLGYADPLTDLGVVPNNVSGPDSASLSVIVGPASVLSEQESSDITLQVVPGAPGAHTATFSVQTDVGAEPGMPGAVYQFVVTWDVAITDPVSTLLASKNGAVPNAGTDARIQAGALWTTFGVPAVNEAGTVAYVGKWKAPAATTPSAVPAQSGVGIFVDGVLVVKVGEAAPDAGGATFKSFKDPVLNDAGEVAFIATLGGAGVTSLNDSVVVANVGGTLMLAAREGSAAPTGDGALWKSFASVAYASDAGSVGLHIEGRLLLATGSPAVTTANDALVVSASLTPPLGGPLPLVVSIREGGSVIGALPTELAKSWRFLASVSGSPGHGRALNNGADSPSFQVTLSSGRQVVANAAGTTAEACLFPGDVLASTALPAAQWKTFGAFSTATTPGDEGAYAMRAVLQSGIGGVVSANATGVFLNHPSESSGWEPVARLSGTAPGMGSGVFKTLGEPVLAADGSRVSFLAKAAGSGITTSDDDAIYTKLATEPLEQLARENGQPPDAPAGAQWKSFTSIAQPSNAAGPLFTATLRTGPQGTAGPGGITSAADTALYGVDSNGSVRELVREGQPLAGKTVKVFNVLKAASGSTGSSRAFNGNAQVVLQVTFTDATIGIVRIALP